MKNKLYKYRKWVWYRNHEYGYECSSIGDRRFSAFYAKLNDGRSIEEHYQVDVKGYRTINEGKGKPPLLNKTRKQLYIEYKKLWKQYFSLNPGLLDELIERVDEKVLTDKFATTDINQARAITDILNEYEKSKRKEHK